MKGCDKMYRTTTGTLGVDRTLRNQLNRLKLDLNEDGAQHNLVDLTNLAVKLLLEKDIEEIRELLKKEA